jgi:hypothetical protein
MKNHLRKNVYPFNRANLWMATSTLSPISSERLVPGVTKAPSVEKILQKYYTDYYVLNNQSSRAQASYFKDKWSIGGVFLAGFVTGFTVAKIM